MTDVPHEALALRFYDELKEARRHGSTVVLFSDGGTESAPLDHHSGHAPRVIELRILDSPSLRQFSEASPAEVMVRRIAAGRRIIQRVGDEPLAYYYTSEPKKKEQCNE